MNRLKHALEALLIAAETPLSLERLIFLLKDEEPPPSRDDIKVLIAGLEQDYQDRGIVLKEVASGFRFQTREEHSQLIGKLFTEKSSNYSRALLETLSIIAYKQPITRGEIETIRGVSLSTSIVRTLQDREWIQAAGHRDVPGQPELFVTTKQFLDYFNLMRLTDLPELPASAQSNGRDETQGRLPNLTVFDKPQNLDDAP